eukprot:2898086-Pleurochrysis_carterae.AAC.2
MHDCPIWRSEDNVPAFETTIFCYNCALICLNASLAHTPVERNGRHGSHCAHPTCPLALPSLKAAAT